MYLVTYDVEYTDEFGGWWRDLSETEQQDVGAVVGMLEERGPTLPHPYSSGIKDSRHSHMRELRVQSGGRPIRILYCFDPRRTGILLLGGDKTGDNRWYEKHIPIADKLYDVYLDELRLEGLLPKT